MSKAMKIVRLQMRLQRPPFRKGLDPVKLRAAQASSGKMPPVAGVSYREDRLRACGVDLAIPETVCPDAVILYIHGGGFISGDPRDYRAFTSFLAKESGFPVYGIIYRLAPEHPFPAGPEDCFSAYAALVQRHPDKKICLIGESAGGTLVLATTMMARDRGLRLPDAVVSYAPGAFFDETIDRSQHRAKDPVVDARALKELGQLYCPQPTQEPYAWIGYGDFHNFPPVRIVWDADETLAPDSRFLAKKLREAGGYLETREWTGTFHTFEMLPTLLPEARQEVLDSIAFMKTAHN